MQPRVRRRVYSPTQKTSAVNQLLQAAGQEMTKMAQTINSLVQIQKTSEERNALMERKEQFYRVAEDLTARGLLKVASVPDWVSAQVQGKDSPETVMRIRVEAARQRNLNS